MATRVLCPAARVGDAAGSGRRHRLEGPGVADMIRWQCLRPRPLPTGPCRQRFRWRLPAMKSRFATVILLLFWGCLPPTTRAAVVVLANRTERAVRFKVSTAPDQARECKLGLRDVLTLPWTGRLDVNFSSGDKPRAYHLTANGVYYFTGTAENLELRQIRFARRWFRPEQTAAEEEPAPADTPAPRSGRLLLKLPVKLLVDQEERT